LRHGRVERLVLALLVEQRLDCLVNLERVQVLLLVVGHGYAYCQRTGRLGCDTSEQGLRYRHYLYRLNHCLNHYRHQYYRHRQHRGYLPTN
jgi:hypothetical protein